MDDFDIVFAILASLALLTGFIVGLIVAELV